MENKNNIEKIKQFLSNRKNDTLLINQVDEEIGSFYELAIEEMSKEIDIKICFNTDIINFFKNIYKINQQELINYCISHPYFTMSEATKYKMNKSSYLADSSINSTNNFILDIRKSIFGLKRSQIDIKKLFMMLKNEVKYKKFNFLVF